MSAPDREKVAAEGIRRALAEWDSPLSLPGRGTRENAGDTLAAAARAWLDDQEREPAWLGETNVDEMQDLVYDRHAHVIDVSKMDPVWVLNRLLPAEEGDRER